MDLTVHCGIGERRKLTTLEFLCWTKRTNNKKKIKWNVQFIFLFWNWMSIFIYVMCLVVVGWNGRKSELSFSIEFFKWCENWNRNQQLAYDVHNCLYKAYNEYHSCIMICVRVCAQMWHSSSCGVWCIFFIFITRHIFNAGTESC